jgi:hypothetical protein
MVACVNGVPVNDRKYAAIKQVTITPDGKTVAFAAQTAAHWRVVVDGKESPEFEEIERILVAPAAPEVFYVSREKPDGLFRLAWFNGAGKPWIAAKQFLQVVPSPDAKHVIYSCFKSVNGKDQTCVEVDADLRLPNTLGEIDLSPDWKWLRYHALKDGVLSRLVKELTLK